MSPPGHGSFLIGFPQENGPSIVPVHFSSALQPGAEETNLSANILPAPHSHFQGAAGNDEQYRLRHPSEEAAFKLQLTVRLAKYQAKKPLTRLTA